MKTEITEDMLKFENGEDTHLGLYKKYKEAGLSHKKAFKKATEEIGRRLGEQKECPYQERHCDLKDYLKMLSEEEETPKSLKFDPECIPLTKSVIYLDERRHHFSEEDQEHLKNLINAGRRYPFATKVLTGFKDVVLSSMEGQGLFLNDLSAEEVLDFADQVAETIGELIILPFAGEE